MTPPPKDAAAQEITNRHQGQGETSKPDLRVLHKTSEAPKPSESLRPGLLAEITAARGLLNQHGIEPSRHPELYVDVPGKGVVLKNDKSFPRDVVLRFVHGTQKEINGYKVPHEHDHEVRAFVEYLASDIPSAEYAPGTPIGNILREQVLNQHPSLADSKTSHVGEHLPIKRIESKIRKSFRLGHAHFTSAGPSVLKANPSAGIQHWSKLQSKLTP